MAEKNQQGRCKASSSATCSRLPRTMGDVIEELQSLRAKVERLEKIESRYLMLTAKIACMNTIFRELVRKWTAEGNHCGQMGREADEEWEDGDGWRERRAVFFDCATELEEAMRKVPRRQRLSENKQNTHP